MPTATTTSQRNRQRLDGPQIGEGLWSVFDAQGCCIVEFATAAGHVNGLKVATAPTGSGPTLSVQGPAADINLNLAAQGAGFVVINSPLEVTGTVKLDSTLEVVGAVTLDSTLEVKGATTLDTTLLVKQATTLQAALTQTGGTASFDSPTLVVNETTHQVIAGQATGAGTHKLVVASSAPGGATLTTALLGLYGTVTPNIMLRETTNNVETYWQATGAGGAAFGTLTAHALALLTSNATRLSIAAGGNVTFGATALFVDETNNRVGVANAAPSFPLDVTGDIRLSAILRFSAASSLVIPGATNLVFLNNAGTNNNLTISDLGAVTTRSTLTVSAGGAAITGNVTLSGVLIFTAASSQVLPGTLSWSVLKNDQSRSNLQILDSGATTIQGGLTVTTGGITVTAGGIIITAGDLTLANAQLKRGTDTWLLPTGLGSDTLVTLTAVQTLTQKTLGASTKILIGGDLTGDMYYNGGSGTLTRIAIGASTTVLVGGASPGWAQVDRTRVVLTTATGIMTLHDAQTKDAAQTFTAQVVAGPSGTGTHQLVCASSAPSGATFTSAQIGVYGSTVANVVLREMTDSVESYWQNTSGGVTFGSLTGHLLQFVTGNGIRLVVSSLGSVIIGSTSAALATTATDGFLYIPTCAGAPTGVPTGFTGTVPIIYDTTNNFLYVRNGGTWKKSTVYA